MFFTLRNFFRDHFARHDHYADVRTFGSGRRYCNQCGKRL